MFFSMDILGIWHEAERWFGTSNFRWMSVYGIEYSTECVKILPIHKVPFLGCLSDLLKRNHFRNHMNPGS